MVQSWSAYDSNQGSARLGPPPIRPAGHNCPSAKALAAFGASIAHPGGNLTGLTMTTGYELAGKRLELLKDMVGGLSRVAVLSNPSNPPLRAETIVSGALSCSHRAASVLKAVPSDAMIACRLISSGDDGLPQRST